MDVGVHDVRAVQHLQRGTDVVFEPDDFCGPQSSSWDRPEPAMMAVRVKRFIRWVISYTR